MMIKFKNVVMNPMESFYGENAAQGWVKLDNELEVSIVRHSGSYGGKKGFYEMGVFKDGQMKHVDAWGDQVKGWLTPEGVDVELAELQKLA